MPRPMSPCPSEGAYRRHLRWGQEPCDGCRAVHARLTNAYRERHRPPARPEPQCGTGSRYRRHLRLNEVPCRPCTNAHAVEVLAWTRRAA